VPVPVQHARYLTCIWLAPHSGRDSGLETRPLHAHPPTPTLSVHEPCKVASIHTPTPMRCSAMSRLYGFVSTTSALICAIRSRWGFGGCAGLPAGGQGIELLLALRLQWACLHEVGQCVRMECILRACAHILALLLAVGPERAAVAGVPMHASTRMCLRMRAAGVHAPPCMQTRVHVRTHSGAHTRINAHAPPCMRAGTPMHTRSRTHASPAGAHLHRCFAWRSSEFAGRPPSARAAQPDPS